MLRIRWSAVAMPPPPRLQGLLDEDPAVVQMSVPNHHRVTPQRGFRVHRPRAWADRRQPASTLPVTRVEDTVLDLVGTTRDRTRSCTGSFAPASAGSPRRPGSVPPLAVDVGSDTGRWFRSW